MKNLPNLISVLRIVCSFGLLLAGRKSGAFPILYLFCGISDVVDGFLARKLHAQSHTGALLDSIGDFVFFGVVVLLFWPMFRAEPFLLIWIIVIILIRLISLLVGFCRYHALAFLHTYGNKITGAALFLLPLLSFFTQQIRGWGILVCVLASLSAVEELLLNCFSKRLNRDVKGLFNR